MRQQYWVLAITAAAAFGLVNTDSWAADLYVNDEFVEEDLQANPPITRDERDTMTFRCSNPDYETINEALEEANSGDTIFLCDCDEFPFNNGGDPNLTTYFPGVGETAAILMPEGLDNITIRSAFGDPSGNPGIPNSLCKVSGIGAQGDLLPVVRVDFTGQELTLGGGINNRDFGFFIQDGTAPSEDLYLPYDPSGDSNASRGGGIRVMGRDAIVEVWDCTITANQSFEDGGGAYCHFKSSLSMNNCTITGNMVNGKGGGIYCDLTGTVILNNCNVDNNDAGLMGGGIFAPEGSIVGLEDTDVCSNTSGWHSKNIWGTFEDLGGNLNPNSNCIAVTCGSTFECDTTAIVWNVAAGQSIQAAINAAGPNDIINVAASLTPYDEFLDMEGKAISLIALGPGPSIIEPPPLGAPGGGGPNGDGPTPCIKFTSGETNATLISGFTLRGGDGTPVFAFADHQNPDDDSMPEGFTVGGGILCYRSMPTIDSCIIRDNGYLNGPPFAFDGGGIYSGGQSNPILTGTTYLCGNFPNQTSGNIDDASDDPCLSPTCDDNNPADGIPDSCQGMPATYFVGPNSGPTPITAAIDQANSGDTISLAAGTYLETINPMGKAIHFDGAGQGQTILDGMGANRLIVCVAGETNGTKFSNLTVKGGNSNRGGGAWLKGSSPAFTDVEFTDNRATDSGGGVYMSNGARPEFTDCTFDGNISTWRGGAIYALGSCRPVFTDTLFNNNQTTIAGGAVCLITAPPVPYPYGLVGNQPDFISCTFTNNRSLRYGGGVFAGFASPAEFDNCTFQNNAGEWGGGGIFVQSINDYADPQDGSPPFNVLMTYYPHVHNGTVFSCCEPQAISGDAQAWYDPWWGDPLNVVDNCLLCAPDINKDLYVDHLDLIRVIDAWGNCEDSIEDDPDSPPLPVLCDEDVDGNYVVDIQDLIEVLENWRRECPF